MTQPLSIQSLQGVSETLLLPLFCRAWLSQRSPNRFQDLEAERLVAVLTPLLKAQSPVFYRRFVKRPSRMLTLFLALRARHFDQRVQHFLQQAPQGRVIQLACGLDTRFQRLGCPEIDWLDLDFQSVIDLRQALNLQVTPCWAGSALDLDWLQSQDRQQPTLILIEGLLMYLPPDQIRNLFRMLADHFQQAQIVAEVFSARVSAALSKGPLRPLFQLKFGLASPVTFQGGLHQSREAEAWHPRLYYQGDWSYFDEADLLGAWPRALIQPMRQVQWVVHYAIGRGLE